MRNSLPVWFLVLVLVLSLPSMGLQVHAVRTPIPFQLGYGLTTLTPVSSGIPVYTVDDTMWALSNFSRWMFLTLARPSSTTGPIQAIALQPGIPVPVHKFTSYDVEGVWSLRLSNQTSGFPIPECSAGTQLATHPSSSAVLTSSPCPPSYYVPVHFVNPILHRLAIGVSQYSLRNDKVLIGFGISSVDEYDQEACLSTSQTGNLVLVPLPKSVGVGHMRMVRSGSNVSISADASFNSSFSFWVEFHHPFSFNINGTAEFVSSDLRAATTAPILVSFPGRSNTTLNWETAARTGRYEARAFFQTPSGLFVEQVRLLMPDGATWFSLDSCQLLRVGSPSISYLASLAGNESAWPSSLHLMYRVFGVESTSTLPLKLNISKVNFVSRDWDVPVDYSGISIQPNPNIQQYALANGSLYLIARSYPLSVGYAIQTNKSGSLSASGSFQVPQPYVVQTLSLSVGKLLVHVLDQESPSAGVRVVLSDASSHSIVKTTDISAYAAFYVQGGEYNVTVTQAGESKTYPVAIVAGQEKDLDVQLHPPSVLPAPLDSLQSILAITGVIGVALNVLVWFVRPRLSR